MLIISIFLFVFRLYGIWEPPLEINHSWRQTTVTMVARNFLDVDANFLYPRVDMAGELTGITGMEFPLLNYLIFIVAKIFGYQHWYGRLINLMVSSVGIWYFFLFVKKQFNRKVAFNASFLLLISLWFAFSRKIMPDTFSCSLAIMSIYHGWKYLGKPKWKDLGLYGLFGLLGMLAKLPVIFLFLYLLFPGFKGSIFTKTKLFFVLVSVTILAPVMYWYFVWSPYLTDHFEFWHFFMGNDFLDGLCDLIDAPLAVLKQLFFTPLRASGTVALIISLVVLVRKKEWKPIITYVFGLVSFILVIAIKAGWTFTAHDYYVMGLVPIFIIPIAVSLTYIDHKKVYPFILAVFMLEGIISQLPDFSVKSRFNFIANLDQDLTDLGVGVNDKIAINSPTYPTPLYFTHRKGWMHSNINFYNPAVMQTMINYGCRYVLILKNEDTFGKDMVLDLPMVENNENYRLYKLPLP